MSQHYNPESESPLALIPIDERMLDDAVTAARVSPRRRMIIRFHEHGELVQRMLNALEPETYARPHRHNDPTKHEVIIALRGRLLVVRFADDGSPLEGYVVEVGGPVAGVEIPPGSWHNIVSLEEGTVVYELNSGPYDPETHKEYAQWAPAEEDLDAGAAYLARLRAHFSAMLPKLAALDTIDAEEDDIC
jgi:cupin fold WbuC family metalloprotein